MRNEEMIEEVPQMKNRMDNLENWQSGVNKALWFVFTTIGGIIIAMIFAMISKK